MPPASYTTLVLLRAGCEGHYIVYYIYGSIVLSFSSSMNGTSNVNCARPMEISTRYVVLYGARKSHSGQPNKHTRRKPHQLSCRQLNSMCRSDRFVTTMRLNAVLLTVRGSRLFRCAAKGGSLPRAGAPYRSRTRSHAASVASASGTDRSVCRRYGTEKGTGERCVQ
jgi:hypothetical protein